MVAWIAILQSEAVRMRQGGTLLAQEKAASALGRAAALLLLLRHPLNHGERKTHKHEQI